MGSDKASLILDGRSLIQRAVDAVGAVADDIVVATAPNQWLPEVESPRTVRIVADQVAGAGPLAGLVSALAKIQAPIALVVACDLPFLQPALLRLLEQQAHRHPVVIPVVRGQAQPQCSALRVEVLPLLHEALERGERALSMLTTIPGARLLSNDEWALADPGAVSFIGANTPSELRHAECISRHQKHDAVADGGQQ